MTHEEERSVPSWNELIGPFYTASTVAEKFGEQADRFIALKTSDGQTVYPQRQFITNTEDGSIAPIDPLISLWNSHIEPAIKKRFVDGWTAAGYLFAPRTKLLQGRSIAAVLSARNVTDEAAADITEYTRWIVERWSFQHPRWTPKLLQQGSAPTN